MTEKEKIDVFLSQQHIAVVGFSRDAKKFGTQVFEMLKTRGYNVYPVNPAGGQTPDGGIVYPALGELPGEVKAAVILTKPAITNQVIKEAVKKGLSLLWVQQMSDNKETLPLLEQSGLTYITKRCIFMYANPGGFHKFHRWLVGLFGRLPK